MFNQIEETILSALQMVYDQFGWAGVFGLMIFENATGITPSEIILALAGWMLIERHALPASLILLGGGVAALGSTIGASLTYWAARLGGRPFIWKFARFLHMDMRLVTSAEQQVQKYGMGIVLIGRVIPGVRTLINIPAGLARMPFPRFFLATLAGAYLWCTLLVGIGYILGHEWMLISQIIRQYLPFLLLAGSLAMIVYLFLQYRKGSLSLPRLGGRESADSE